MVRVRKVVPAVLALGLIGTGSASALPVSGYTIWTVAGDGTAGFSGDGMSWNRKFGSKVAAHGTYSLTLSATALGKTAKAKAVSVRL